MIDIKKVVNMQEDEISEYIEGLGLESAFDEGGFLKRIWGKLSTTRFLVGHVNAALNELKSLEKIDIKNIMDKFIEKEYNSKIESFFIVSKKLKTGLDLEPIIYNFDETFSLSEFSNIKSILDVERSNYPYFYIYLKLKENDSLNKSFKERFLKSFGKYLADEVNEIIKNKLKEKDE